MGFSRYIIISCLLSIVMVPLTVKGDTGGASVVETPKNPPGENSSVKNKDLVANRDREQNRDEEKDNLYEENRRNIRQEMKQRAKQDCCEYYGGQDKDGFQQMPQSPQTNDDYYPQ